MKIKSKFVLLSSIVGVLNQYYNKLSFYFSLINKFYFLSDLVKGMNYSRMAHVVNNNFYSSKTRLFYNNFRCLYKFFGFMNIRGAFVNENKFVTDILFSKKLIINNIDSEGWVDDNIEEIKEQEIEDVLDTETLDRFEDYEDRGQINVAKDVDKGKDQEDDDVIFVRSKDVMVKFSLISKDWFVRRQNMRDRLYYIRSLNFMKRARYLKSKRFFNKDVFKKRWIDLLKKIKRLFLVYASFGRWGFVKSFKNGLWLRVLNWEKYY